MYRVCVHDMMYLYNVYAAIRRDCHDQLVRFSLEALANLRHFHARLYVGLDVPCPKKARDRKVEKWCHAFGR